MRLKISRYLLLPVDAAFSRAKGSIGMDIHS
jgi:hypothetical protein